MNRIFWKIFIFCSSAYLSHGYSTLSSWISSVFFGI